MQNNLFARGFLMRFAKFLYNNVRWNFDRDAFSGLCCAPTPESTLFDQLDRISDRYFPQQKRVETVYTEFCLNEIALATPQNAAQRYVKKQFGAFWQTFVRLKNSFGKPFALFPADERQTRLEVIAKLVTQCTQFAITKETAARINDKIFSTFDLEEREKRHLENVLELYRINFYCAAARGVFKKSATSEIRIAKMFDECNIGGEYVFNARLRQTGYRTEKLAAVVNCLSNSATRFFAPTQTEMKPFFFCNNRNVFDTFCYSKLGNNTAQFYSQSETLRIEMQYFLQGNCEIRRYSLHNRGKILKRITADFLFRHLDSGSRTNYFPCGGALCLSVEGENEFYTALALVRDDKVLPCEFEEGRISQVFEIPCGQKVGFAAVTLFAESMPELADALQSLNSFGSTRCPYLTDSPSANAVDTKQTLNPTLHGYLARKAPEKDSATFTFTYRLGQNGAATFLDNAGNCTTLIDGFVFGIKGERIYCIKNNFMQQLNCGKFALEKDALVYRKSSACCKITHENGKSCRTSYADKRRTLFYFPLEEKSEITFENNVFRIKSKLRDFRIKCACKPESFTSNALECNPDRMRYKLSGNLSDGTCLAICFAASSAAEVNICAQSDIPAAAPIVKESLISTYMNYVNDKNVFCLCNFLKRADSLTLAAITFSNPQFIKYYAQNIFEKHRFFYDAAGRRKNYFDKLALPLALIYYANIGSDTSFFTEDLKKYVSSVLFGETFAGRDLCIKALALKKAANIEGFDKVKCLVEYNNLKKTVTSDAKLYAYAQAIGAVEMINPSKARLKDLCGRFDIPKSWYYVSQLENLYGMSLSQGTLHFAPKVTQENVLEQLALNVFGKRIDTTFTKSTVQSMTLNGVQYFLPLKMQSLRQEENVLEVKY